MYIVLEALILFFILLSDILLSLYIKKTQKESSLSKSFFWSLICMSIVTLGQFLQLVYFLYTGVESVYFEYFIYIGLNYLPTFLFFVCLSLKKGSNITLKKVFLILFIIPIINLLLLWTNDIHHLFFIEYSTDMSKTQFGPLAFVHKAYVLLMYMIAMISLIRTSFRSKGFFFKQSFLIIISILIPVIVNFVGFFKILPVSVYSISFTFSATILFCALSVFKFNFFDVSPLALQKIIEDMSDSYLILNKNNLIVDYNNKFLHNFNIKNINIKNVNFLDLLSDDMKNSFYKAFSKSVENQNQNSIKFYDANLDKYFIAQISPVLNNNIFIGTFILFKDITQHEKDMKEIKDKQEVLLESERLSSLGQLIGGIAHNFKTPIMSISGATEALLDLVKEYDVSIDDPSVNSQDHHEIANDMVGWIDKIKSYTEYMSDIIATVKGQAASYNEEDDNNFFDLDELIKRVNILMRHELKNALVYLNVQLNIDSKTTVKGDINSLVQVINNMITNAIQAYDGKPEQDIDLIFDIKNDNLLITVKDYGPGLPEKVKGKLFKEMITTKGKNGTGIGLYMSYSTIKVHFKGYIYYDSSNKGTSFYILIPLSNK